MIIQIYEISSLQEAKDVVKAGADHLGVLVGRGQYPGELPIEQVKDIFKFSAPGIKKVALSLSAELKEICEIVEGLKPDILHIGAKEEDLPLEKVKEIKEKYPDLKIMRAIAVINQNSVATAKKYEQTADFLLLDTCDKNQFGATGKVHNWDISKEIVQSVTIPVILAGGLGPDNVAEAIKKVRPAGVDSKTKTDKINSNEKDLDKVKEFAKIAKSYEN